MTEPSFTYVNFRPVCVADPHRPTSVRRDRNGCGEVYSREERGASAPRQGWNARADDGFSLRSGTKDQSNILNLRGTFGCLRLLPPIKLGAAMASIADRPAHTGAGRTILVAEDEVLIRHDISEYLRSHGFNVIEANSATEAIQVLKDSLDVSVVFTDVRMPGTIDGIDLAHYIKKHHPQIPVLITSGHIPSAELPKDLGRLIDKPYERELVMQAIIEALCQRL